MSNRLTGYNQVNLSELLKSVGEDKTKEIVSGYRCGHNKDIEDFLRHKAVEFAKQNLAPTHLVFASHMKKVELIGYYTLTVKTFKISKKALSQTMTKKINKFGSYNSDEKAYLVAAPLIAQLGKNYRDGLDKVITGDELLEMACTKVKETQKIVGGKLVYLECEDNDFLIDFYNRNNFIEFNRRPVGKGYTDESKTGYLIQMFRYLNI